MQFSAPIYRLKRQARDIARAQGITLAQALDRVAACEGYQSWSHLAAQTPRPAPTLLDQFAPGDLVAVAARPGHGKTLLALELAADAARAGRAAHVFTLEYHEAEVAARLRDLGIDPTDLGARFRLDTSDDICATYILERLADAPKGTLAVIDYLQLLDQKRSHPPLDVQLRALADGARRLGAIILVLSQVGRAYARQARDMPVLSDIRLPNPADLSLISKACFLQDGRIQLQRCDHSPA